MDLLSDYQHFNAVMLRRRLNREFPAGLQEGAVNYLQKLSLHGRRENTLRSHRNVLLRFTDYLFSVGVTDYKLLSADIVNRYVKVVSCNYSNSVVRLHYSILLRFFQYLAHSGYKETDLSLKMMPIVKVSASARIPTTLDLSQIESILASVDRESPQGKRDYAVLMIAVKLGIRTSDIRNLRPANFNWEQPFGVFHPSQNRRADNFTTSHRRWMGCNRLSEKWKACKRCPGNFSPRSRSIRLSAKF